MAFAAIQSSLSDAELRALRRLARRAASDANSRCILHDNLRSKCGAATLGQRLRLQKLLQRCEPTRVTMVCNHYREDTCWMLPLLDACDWVSLVIYDCAVEPLPIAVVQHERVEVRDKSGPLASAPFFFGAFDFCARECREAVEEGETAPTAAEWYLFLHGHDTAWHQKLPISALVALAVRAASRDPQLEYCSLNDQLLPDWITPGVDEWTAHGVASPSMLRRVAHAWPTLQPLLGGDDASAPPPEAIFEIHGAQALVARARLHARPAHAWARLRDHVATLPIHSDADYAMEAAFHRCFGEPWCRPFVQRHAAVLLRGAANELELRCGCRYNSAAPRKGDGAPAPASEAEHRQSAAVGVE